MRISDWSSDVCSSDLSPWHHMGRCLHRTSFGFSRELVVGEYTSWYIFIPSRTFIILSVRHRHKPRPAARPAVCGGDIGMAEKSALDQGAASYLADALIGYIRLSDQSSLARPNTRTRPRGGWANGG